MRYSALIPASVIVATAPFAAALLQPEPGAEIGHWSLQPVDAPPIPEVDRADWPDGPVDRFILARLEAASLAPSPEADRAALIRRLHFDLTGLPPRFEEVQSFVADPDPDAYRKLVERLLASPAFGERWARHWLDVARYSDTKGYVFEEARDYPYAYAYRDWVIGAFNSDLPYDQFLLYQIAADRAVEEEGAHRKHLAAMAFLTVGRRFLNRQPDIIADRIDVTFRGMQALTVACARCHDHTYDPIPTADYYSLYGVFDSSEEPGELPLLGEAPDSEAFRAFEAELAAKQKAIDDYLAGRSAELVEAAAIARYLQCAQDGLGLDDEALKKLASERKLLQRVTLRWRDRLRATAAGDPDPVFSPWHAFATIPDEGDEGFRGRAAEVWRKLEAGGAIHPAVAAGFAGASLESMGDVASVYGAVLAAASAGDDAALLAAIEPATIDAGQIYRLLETPGQQHVRRLRRELESVKTEHPGAPPRGMVMVDREQAREPHIFQRGDPGRRGERVPRQFLKLLKGDSREPFERGSGRLELARELTSRENPLTARVWVNRVWGHLMGAHLVDTPSDFGLRSEPPSHPLLLDHLAAGLMEDGWSTKALVRDIVLSRTYRQVARASEAARTRDPENRLFSHANIRRADFESFRDAMLSVAEQLDPTTGGRPVEISGDAYSKRRTVYGKVERQNLPPVFRTFDFASPDVHVPKRPETTVPQQALFMLNGRFAQDMAAALLAAPRCRDEEGADRVRALYRQVFARDPSSAEIADALAFLDGGGEAEGGSWEYGYGRYDSERAHLAFTPLPHFERSRWQGGASLPDPQLGWVSIHKTGGHPGGSGKAAIWRWRAPADGRYQIRGTIELPAAESDGVVGAVFKNAGERLGAWHVEPQGNAATHLDEIPLKRGDSLEFVVACGQRENHDSFLWNPGVRDVETRATWVASEGFAGQKPPSEASRWEQLAQALLASNEFAFID